MPFNFFWWIQEIFKKLDVLFYFHFSSVHHSTDSHEFHLWVLQSSVIFRERPHLDHSSFQLLFPTPSLILIRNKTILKAT